VEVRGMPGAWPPETRVRKSWYTVSGLNTVAAGGGMFGMKHPNAPIYPLLRTQVA